MKTPCASFALLLLAGSFAAPAAAQAPSCDPAFVAKNENRILVTPTGVDDTANLQCALDLGAGGTKAEVQLDVGDFFVSEVAVRDFRGTLQGRGAANTRVEVIDGSIDCVAAYDGGMGRTPAAIRFEGGQPTVRYLAIETAMPCIGDQDDTAARSFSALLFTGYDNVNVCDASAPDIVFATVDRVAITGPGQVDGATYGVSVIADGFAPTQAREACIRPLAGSFELLGSTISGFRIGARSELTNGARVSVFGNDFDTNRTHYLTWYGEQYLAVERNDFTNPARPDGNVAVSIQVTDGARGHMIVRRNQFEVTSTVDRRAFGVLLEPYNQSPTNPVVVADNTFVLSGPRARGVTVDGEANGVIRGNNFSGEAQHGIEVLWPTIVMPCTQVPTDWSIVSNNGLGALMSHDADIRLRCVSNVVVGPFQAATVEGSQGNFVLD